MIWLWLFLAWALPVVVRVVLALRRESKVRSSNLQLWIYGQQVDAHCMAAPRMSRRGWLGFGRLVEGLRATKSDRGPQYVIESLDSEYGDKVHTVFVPIFDYDLIVSRDPVNVKYVLSTGSADWDVSKHRADSWRPLVGHGIFTSHGEDWKISRALVRPQFALDQINDLDLFERHVQQLFHAIDKHHGTFDKDSDPRWTRAFDLQPLFYNLTLDVVTEWLYGYSVHSQNPSERAELPIFEGREAPNRETIGASMDAGKFWVETRGALWKYRWLLPTWWFSKHCAAVHAYADWFVQLRLKRGPERFLEELHRHHSQAGDAFAAKERFVLLHELAKVTQDAEELRSQTLNVLTAGRDTTAALLGWVFYQLARHPRVWAELRREVLNHFGPYVPGQACGFSFRQIRDELPYLHAVVNETFRVSPVVPLNERVALRDTVLPRGGGPMGTAPIYVPEGTQILIPTYAMQMREDLWGRDVKEFRPERWIENGGRKFSFDFIPFGGGVRQCLGQQFARIKSAYVIIRIMQRYDDIQNAERPPDAPMRFHHTIENRSGTGVQIRLHKANMDH